MQYKMLCGKINKILQEIEKGEGKIPWGSKGLIKKRPDRILKGELLEAE